MSAIEVTTQAQLDEALENLRSGEYVVCLGGTRDDPLVAYGSATVHAYGSATVRASGSATVRATPYVAISKQSNNVKTSGGVVIDAPDPATLDAKGWCDFYGVEVKRGIATLFKAVDDDLSTDNARARGLFYTVGAKVVCPDWESHPSCGNGLHASPRPFTAAAYNGNASRYVAVRCKVADLVVLGDKVKAPAFTVAFECDLDGEPIETSEPAAA